jgi:RHS repeat-associated protein
VPWWDAEYQPEAPGQLVLLAPLAKASSGSSPARSLPSSVRSETSSNDTCITVQSRGQRARVRGTLAARSTASTARSEGELTRGGAFRDWLGNTDKTTDDANGFYDRSLGAVTNDTAANKPYQLKSATLSGARGGTVRAKYDDAGHMIRMDLARSGPCLPVGATCSQRFAYDWDEVGRLGRARRWDTAPGASIDDPLPGGTPAADLRYTYDAGDQRVIKHAVDASGESFTLYVFESLEFKRSQFGTAYSDSGSGPADYEASVFTVVPYLLANGVRLARLAYEGMSEVPEVTPGTGAGQINASVSQVHVFFELGDHLGSTSVVLDKATSELVERSTFQGYGATESDYRPGRWNAFREDYKFTGKEEDAEVGLTYFGKRYLNAYLGRWISADPLAIHAPGEADLNVYAYVSGSFLKNVDPLGLEEAAVEQEPKVSVDEVVDYAQELSYISASTEDREWFRNFLGSGSAIDQELSGYWEQHREEFINSPLDSNEKAAFDYLQSQGTAREQFMQLRAGARAHIYDNMPGFDFGSNGSERSYAEETKRGKPASNIFYHWMGLGMDWQLTLGPRSGAQQEGRMIAAEGTSNPDCQICLNMRSDVLSAYNDAIAQISREAGVVPGYSFRNSMDAPTPHSEHFQIQVFRGEPVTKATEMKVMMGAPGYDQKPLQIEVLVPKKGGEQR